MQNKTLKVFLHIAVALFVLCFSIFISYLLSYLSIKDTNIPRVDISVSEKIDSKEEYVACEISISGTENYDIEALTGEIRGRGNTTWKFYPKKPYRIKLDSKTSLFGEKASKSWVLLALYNDYSLSKDALAFKLGAALGNDTYVPSYHYVEVYINGKYNGLYLLTEQINENSERTNIEYDFTENDVAVPFLVELDSYADEDGSVLGVDYFKIGDLNYSVKYPDSNERYTLEQFDYIKNYINKVNSLAYSKNVDLNELCKYVDIESLIDYYIIQEIMAQADIAYKSVYMYKSIDGKLTMGPLWDYDWSLDGPSLFYWIGYEYKDNEFASEGTWFYALLNNSEEFRKAVKQRWGEIEEKIRLAADEFYSESDKIFKSAGKDWLRWHCLNAGAQYMDNFEKAYSVLISRINWLDDEIGQF